MVNPRHWPDASRGGRLAISYAPGAGPMAATGVESEGIVFSVQDRQGIPHAAVAYWNPTHAGDGGSFAQFGEFPVEGDWRMFDVWVATDSLESIRNVSAEERASRVASIGYTERKIRAATVAQAIYDAWQLEKRSDVITVEI